MPKTRIPGSDRSREITGGREVTGSAPLGKGKGTRIVAQPKVTPIFDHCRDKNKHGQPCKAHNVTGKPYCQGHLMKRERIRENG